MECPHCHAPLAADSRFCGACGRAAMPTASDSRLPIVDPMARMIGQEIAGRFRVVALLGEGGMGAVFRAEQLSLKRTVALKLLKPSLAASSSLIQRFNAEAQAVAQLNHPNTVGIYDFGAHDGMLFIAMELIEGRALRDLVHREAPLPPPRALMIAIQVAASLADAHAHGIIHRDLKPDNVMLQQRGKASDIVRVLDFGIAKLRDDAHGMTRAGDIMGTPQYIAPEQAKGDAIDGRTDVYALGCMLYEMLSGRLPFESDSVMALLAAHVSKPVIPISQRRPDLHIPPALDALVVAAMAKDPGLRPPTMEAFGEHMSAILATLNATPWNTTVAPVVTPIAPSLMMPPPRASRAPLYAVLGVLAACGIGAGIWAAQRKPVAHADPDPDLVAHLETTDDPPPFDPATQGLLLPAGAKLIPLAGYTQTRDASSDKLFNPQLNVLIQLQPVNDRGDMHALAPALAKQWGLVVDHIGTVMSAGKPRDAGWFSGVTNNVPMKMMVIIYDGPDYRIGCVGAEPLAIWDEQAALRFFAENVVMP